VKVDAPRTAMPCQSSRRLGTMVQRVVVASIQYSTFWPPGCGSGVV
jgi:hypothetical protein